MRSATGSKQFIVTLALVIVTRAASAPSTFGSIVGTALDQSALALPGATVTPRHAEEHTAQSTVSDANGTFQFLNLKPGGYEIDVSLPGFSDATLQDLRLDARQTLRVSITLAIAGVAENVKVSAFNR